MERLVILKQPIFDRRVFLTCEGDKLVGINYWQDVDSKEIIREVDEVITIIFDILSQMSEISLNDYKTNLGFNRIQLINLAIAVDFFRNSCKIVMLEDKMLNDNDSLGYNITEALARAFYKWLGNEFNSYFLSDCVSEAIDYGITEEFKKAIQLIDEFIASLCRKDGVNSHQISQDVAFNFLATPSNKRN